MKKFIITISREFVLTQKRSPKAAAELGVEFYDKDQIWRQSVQA